MCSGMYLDIEEVSAKKNFKFVINIGWVYRNFNITTFFN